jgi:hypothetical protein
MYIKVFNMDTKVTLKNSFILLSLFFLSSCIGNEHTGRSVGIWGNRYSTHELQGRETGNIVLISSRKIFEGDVLKIKCNEDIIIGDVFYNQGRCCYMIKHPAGYNGSFGLNALTIEICDEFHIVGNIYQNPELLGGQDE